MVVARLGLVHLLDFGFFVVPPFEHDVVLREVFRF